MLHFVTAIQYVMLCVLGIIFEQNFPLIRTNFIELFLEILYVIRKYDLDGVNHLKYFKYLAKNTKFGLRIWCC